MAGLARKLTGAEEVVFSPICRLVIKPTQPFRACWVT
jgi:hypothetical protein